MFNFKTVSYLLSFYKAKNGCFLLFACYSVFINSIFAIFAQNIK